MNRISRASAALTLALGLALSGTAGATVQPADFSAQGALAAPNLLDLQPVGLQVPARTPDPLAAAFAPQSPQSGEQVAIASSCKTMWYWMSLIELGTCLLSGQGVGH